MGYYSNVYTHQLFVTAKPEPVDEEKQKKLEELKLLATEAGVELKLPTSANSIAELVKTYLKAHDGYFGYWFTVEEVAENAIELVAVGESGKAYDFADELSDFVKLLVTNELTLNGVIIIEGEEQGDVSRYKITDNSIAFDEAQLVFSDGTTLSEYGR